MSRKPAILELIGGKSQRQRVWESLRAFAGTDSGFFTADALSRSSKVEIDPINTYLKGLHAAGYIGIVGDVMRGVKNVYQMMRDNGVEAPRVRRDGSPVTQGRGNEALWSAMTVLDSFSPALLAEIAGVKASTASAYCKALSKAGYLQVITAGKGTGKGGIASIWALSPEHRLKPRAPMITRLHAVYDPNIHSIVWSEGADEAADAVEMGEVL